MKRSPNRQLALAIALGAIALLGAAFTGCGGGDSETAGRASMVAAIDYLENSGFHEIDTSITTDGKVPATAHNTAMHMQTVLLTAQWPASLEEQAKTVAKALGDFATAVDTDNPDIPRVTEFSNKAHAGYHDFTTKAWNYLAGVAGLGTAGSHENHAAPAATATK